MRRPSPKACTLPLLVAALSSVVACVDEKIVYRDRELFEDPLTAAAGFLGYTDHETKLTVCGNCHVEKQAKWSGTAHARAWKSLQDSEQAVDLCEGCHTVGELGSKVEGIVGYAGTEQARYEDVQCEACHGPGLDHASNPTRSTIPLAPITVGLDAKEGCGECHRGAHHPFVEQWQASGHARLRVDLAGRDDCRGCHSGGGALEAWNVSTAYLGQGDPFPIACAVCHDPHDADNEGQLRFPIGGVAIEDNLCSRCHHRRTAPDGTSSHGLHPHAPETGLLEGDVGWFPPGLTINRGEIIASHGSAGNTRLCATCHVRSTTIEDEATGEFVFTAVGHGFNAIPCVDALGVPNAADCALTTDSRLFEGCTTAGCHGSESAALAALRSATTALQLWTEELHDLLVQVDGNLSGPGGEIDAEDGVFTVAEGAFFNMELAEFGGSGRPDPLLAFAGAASHNPFLTEQLLIASIRIVRDRYGVALSSPDLLLERRIGVDGR